MFRFISSLLLISAACTLFGCSTISGFGRDVEAVGGGVAAEPAKKR